MEKRIYKILCATGLPALDTALSGVEDYEIVGSCAIKSEIKNRIQEWDPQIVIFSDKISGDENIIKLIIDLKQRFPYIRFIYLAGNLNPRDTARVDMLGTLVLSGIYDILISQKINIDLVSDVIENPIAESSVRYLTKNLLSNKSEIDNAIDGIEFEDFSNSDEHTSIVVPNLYVFSSVKPGTGKSFVSVNVACAIAKYGKDKPKVALIEADMQTLSVGTLLSVNEEDDKNMKTALQAISSIFDRGNIVATDEKVRKVNKQIKNCFVKYKAISNLSVLVGSSMTPEEVDALKLSPEFFSYLIDTVKDDYDVIIIDMNSSLFHVTTFPLLQRSKYCYYIINLDFNNVRNNVRYRNTLKSLGITHKLKYVLNEDIENTSEFDHLGVDVEELYFTAEKLEKDYFKLSARIPLIYKTVFLNRLYEGTPVVLDEDSVSYTNKAKLSLMDIANTIHPLNNSYEKLQKKLNKKKSSGFLFFKKKKKAEKEDEEMEEWDG